MLFFKYSGLILSFALEYQQKIYIVIYNKPDSCYYIQHWYLGVPKNCPFGLLNSVLNCFKGSW